jgi:hypothetical protein
MNTPTCGVLTRNGVEESQQTFALFWSYSVEQEYSYELGIGDQVDLTNESVIFADTDANTSCEEYYTNFQYIVDADMPVDGQTATAYLRQSEGDSAEKLSATALGLSALMSAKISNLF